ncbi:MAG: hypothetical protein R3C03_14735 [Pirellulaceae bacterium]
MIRDFLSYLDYGIYAEAALVIFALVFIAIVIRTLLTRKEIIDQQASVVLHDHEEKN